MTSRLHTRRQFLARAGLASGALALATTWLPSPLLAFADRRRDPGDLSFDEIKAQEGTRAHLRAEDGTRFATRVGPVTRCSSGPRKLE